MYSDIVGTYLTDNIKVFNCISLFSKQDLCQI